MKTARKDCYLYWIHRKCHTDILSEGYVGVSINPESRFANHRASLKNPSLGPYRTDFRNAMAENDLVFDVLLKSTQDYCLVLERKIRPRWSIGWNIAIGGNGGVCKHGLSTTQAYGVYQTVKYRSVATGCTITDEWLGEEGVIKFIEFYTENSSEDKELFLPKNGEINKDTVFFQTRKECLQSINRVHKLPGDSALYSIDDLARKFNIRANTISTRISRGMTVLQAVGLGEKEVRKVTFNGREFKYSGKLTDAQFREVVSMYESGATITEISKCVDMDSGNLSRLCRKYSLNRPKDYYVDF